MATMTAAAAISAAVLGVHQPIDALDCHVGRVRQVCTGCGTDDGNWQTWPCPTVRAMREAVRVETSCEVYYDSDCVAEGDISPCVACGGGGQ